MPLDSRYLHKYKDKFEVKVLHLVWWCADIQTLKHKRPPSRTPDAILDPKKNWSPGSSRFPKLNDGETRVLLQANSARNVFGIFVLIHD